MHRHPQVFDPVSGQRARSERTHRLIRLAIRYVFLAPSKPNWTPKEPGAVQRTVAGSRDAAFSPGMCAMMSAARRTGEPRHSRCACRRD